MNAYKVVRREGDKYTSHVKEGTRTLASYRLKSCGNRARDRARSKDIVWQLSITNQPVKQWLKKQPDIHLV